MYFVLSYIKHLKPKYRYLLGSFIIHLFFIYFISFVNFVYFARPIKQDLNVLDVNLDFVVGKKNQVPKTLNNKKQHKTNFTQKISKPSANHIKKDAKNIPNVASHKTTTTSRVQSNAASKKANMPHLKKSVPTNDRITNNVQDKTQIRGDAFIEEDEFEHNLFKSGMHNTLSVENKQYIQSKIEQYRDFTHIIPESHAKSIEIIIVIRLNIDGSIREIIDLYDNAVSFVNKNVRKAMIYQNRRAIALAAPFDKLNPDNFEDWKQVTLIFKH